MNERKFWDPSQPQTLQIATFLLYFRAALGLLRLGGLGWLMVPVGLFFGAYGMANGKRWGYFLAVTMAVLDVVSIIEPYGFDYALRVNTVSLLFAGALVALLLHPESREYQRIWFR